MQKLGFAFSPILKVRVVQTSSVWPQTLMKRMVRSDWLPDLFRKKKKNSHIMTKLASVMIGLDINLFLVFLLTSTSSWSL